MAAVQTHPIFNDINRGDLEAVQQPAGAHAAVLEERDNSDCRLTPLMHAICRKKLAIALWLIQHWGQHRCRQCGAV